MKDIKIIHVTQKFWPTIGGGQTHIMGLAKSLADKQVDVEVVCLRYETKQKENDDFGFKIKYSPIKELKIPVLKQIILAFFVVWMCFKALNERDKEKQNIIHTHDEFPFFIFMLLKLFFRYKLIATEHRSFMSKGEKLTKGINKINYFLGRSLADQIIAVDENIYRRLKESKLKKIRCIENWVDTDKFYFERKERRYVTFLGKFDHLKGADIFLDLMIELNKKKKGLNFLMLGYGPLEEEIRKSAKENSINLTIKKVNYPESRTYINESIFLVNPLRIQGISLVTLESMACGCINLKSSVNGFIKPIKEGKNGFLFDLENFEELKNKALYILDNQKKLEKIRKSSILYIKEKYSLEKAIFKIIKIYKEIFV